MGWERTWDRYGEIIDRKLRDNLTKLVDAAKAYHPFVVRVYGALEDFVLRRGKRLASCSALLTYKGYAGEIDDRILNVCVGIEFYRHCILIHDDLIDGDDLRRGGKTFHRLLTEGHDDRLGKGTSVFAGDIAYALALRSVLSSGFPQDKLGKVVLLLSDGYRGVNESQILDLLFEHKEPSVDEWYVMASRRAASLFTTTFQTGGILGGASDGDLRILREAGSHVGYSFDIQDDIIDTFASQEQYGRRPGGDLAHGKKPLHVIYALELADSEGLRTLKRLTGRGHISSGDLELVRNVIRDCGALKAAKARSREHAESARTLIAQTRLTDETKGLLSSLIMYVEESLDWYK